MLGTLSQKQIDELLTRNVTGRIGCHDGDHIYIVPVSYAYNEKYIIAHSREGLKIEMMRKNPKVCFEVDEIHDLGNWQSAIAQGTYEEITDERERYYAMKFLVSRLKHLKIGETARLPHMAIEGGAEEDVPVELRPVVYRIRLDHLTGRFESSI
ncbi:pyridoxamine 5'-phosphate oxidase family protein [Chitinophaga filiformis]|uniref:Pyridoxamine 5'-phosphate oxidase family protein n=1 Tax=Chitinophaga filiformis TaxID=104663 RepID=A0ABY4ID33_CHIFI|nr:pyridoxamine 5'-phosphate oxidase family protein [Chitinophaga filiformis]UPK72716.1 pyridoxamine 5'-phosphate oxidase family protein [Chitinophaga filiformis]